MYRKLKELNLIKNDYDGVNIEDDEIEMNSSFNQLMTDDSFNKKQESETNEEYKFRISYHSTIINSTKIKGDMAKVLTFMHINKLKYNTEYDSDYERILEKLNS